MGSPQIQISCNLVYSQAVASSAHLLVHSLSHISDGREPGSGNRIGRDVPGEGIKIEAATVLKAFLEESRRWPNIDNPVLIGGWGDFGLEVPVELLWLHGRSPPPITW